MRTAALVGCAVLLAACESAAGPRGPAKLGIVSGNHQLAVAGSDSLGKPVVGRLVYTESGSVAWKVLSAFRPTFAYAQEGTVVTGSPIPGKVVCSAGVSEAELIPFTPCTETDNDGEATLFYSPGTKAGIARAEIRGILDGQPAVFDTVIATIEPGVVRFFNFEYTPPSPYIVPGDTVDILAGLSHTRDAYGNEIPDLASTNGDIVRWGWSDTSAEPTTTRTGWKAIMPDTTGFHGRDLTYYRDICEVPDGTSACMKKYVGRLFDLILTVWIGDSNPASSTVSMKFDAPDDPTNR
jgi:hypothetical protein